MQHHLQLGDRPHPQIVNLPYYRSDSSNMKMSKLQTKHTYSSVRPSGFNLFLTEMCPQQLENSVKQQLVIHDIKFKLGIYAILMLFHSLVCRLASWT